MLSVLGPGVKMRVPCSEVVSRGAVFWGGHSKTVRLGMFCTFTVLSSSHPALVWVCDPSPSYSWDKTLLFVLLVFPSYSFLFLGLQTSYPLPLSSLWLCVIVFLFHPFLPRATPVCCIGLVSRLLLVPLLLCLSCPLPGPWHPTHAPYHLVPAFPPS